METILNDTSSHTGVKRNKQKKLSTHVDMTPMVDLAFLLVTFFVLTTSMTRPKAMPVILPEKGDSAEWRKSETLNLLIGDNVITCYYGTDLASNQKIGWNEIREFLAEANKRILNIQHKNNWKENGAMTLIKPTRDCSYSNLVNILDELKIDQINSYAIVDANPEELAAIK